MSWMLFYERQDFACPHCGKNEISDDVIFYANALIRLSGRATVLTSGYRCSEHNAAVGGSPTSTHLAGLAWDVACDNSPLRSVYCGVAYRLGIVRIGLYFGYIHFDLDEARPGALWIGK